MGKTSGMKKRVAVVSGKFYPDNPRAISEQLSNILAKEQPYLNQGLYGKSILGGVVPHAGFMFSGYEAVHFFDLLKHANNQPKTFIIINPNHTGYGPEIALDTNTCWETPYGDVAIDQELSAQLPFSHAGEAHEYEHAAEVMLPMLQYFLDYSFRIVPICMRQQTPENARTIADSITKAISGNEDDYCVIASSDFSHYIEPAIGKQLDWPVINNILDQDASRVFNRVKQQHLTICGFGPIMSLIYYSWNTSRSIQTKLLRYGHSGEVVPSNEVVDYASIVYYR